MSNVSFFGIASPGPRQEILKPLERLLGADVGLHAVAVAAAHERQASLILARPPGERLGGHRRALAEMDRQPAAALRDGDPAVLGEDIGRFLGGTTLNRALALLAGARPSHAAEEDLLRRIAEADPESVRR